MRNEKLPQILENQFGLIIQKAVNVLEAEFAKYCHDLNEFLNDKDAYDIDSEDSDEPAKVDNSLRIKKKLLVSPNNSRKKVIDDKVFYIDSDDEDNSTLQCIEPTDQSFKLKW